MIHKMLLGAFLAVSPMLANAAGLNGAELSIAWAIPFAGILLSIALCPMLVPHFWHNHFGKVAGKRCYHYPLRHITEVAQTLARNFAAETVDRAVYRSAFRFEPFKNFDYIFFCRIHYKIGF